MDAHRKTHDDLDRWRKLSPGQGITVVKLSPDGAEAARYSGVVIANALEDDWLALRATWTYKRVEIDGLVFEPRDELIEWFSPLLPFNAFAVVSPAGDVRGWYANVTYPAYLERTTEDPGSITLVWHDLYLDLVGLDDGVSVVRDEDELEDSGLAVSSPLLHTEIIAAGHELARRFASLQMPFRLIESPLSADFDRRGSQE